MTSAKYEKPSRWVAGTWLKRMMESVFPSNISGQMGGLPEETIESFEETLERTLEVDRSTSSRRTKGLIKAQEAVMERDIADPEGLRGTGPKQAERPIRAQSQHITSKGTKEDISQRRQLVSPRPPASWIPALELLLEDTPKKALVMEDNVWIFDHWMSKLRDECTVIGYKYPHLLEKALQEKPDLLVGLDFVVLDYVYQGSDQNGDDVILCLRNHGYKGPIFLCSDFPAKLGEFFKEIAFQIPKVPLSLSEIKEVVRGKIESQRPIDSSKRRSFEVAKIQSAPEDSPHPKV